MNEPITILPAEYVGHAKIIDGHLDIGGLSVPFTGMLDGEGGRNIGVYVRRSSRDLQVIEIAMAKHDGLAQEELDYQNAEAKRYPLGPKEYWRSQMVGKYTYGADRHLMTDEDFEEDWADFDE